MLWYFLYVTLCLLLLRQMGYFPHQKILAFLNAPLFTLEELKRNLLYLNTQYEMQTALFMLDVWEVILFDTLVIAFATYCLYQLYEVATLCL